MAMDGRHRVRRVVDGQRPVLRTAVGVSCCSSVSPPRRLATRASGRGCSPARDPICLLLFALLFGIAVYVYFAFHALDFLVMQMTGRDPLTTRGRPRDVPHLWRKRRPAHRGAQLPARLAHASALGQRRRQQRLHRAAASRRCRTGIRLRAEPALPRDRRSPRRARLALARRDLRDLRLLPAHALAVPARRPRLRPREGARDRRRGLRHRTAVELALPAALAPGAVGERGGPGDRVRRRRAGSLAHPCVAPTVALRRDRDRGSRAHALAQTRTRARVGPRPRDLPGRRVPAGAQAAARLREEARHGSRSRTRLSADPLGEPRGRAAQPRQPARAARAQPRPAPGRDGALLDHVRLRAIRSLLEPVHERADDARRGPVAARRTQTRTRTEGNRGLRRRRSCGSSPARPSSRTRAPRAMHCAQVQRAASRSRT